MEEQVTITKKEYDQLKKDSIWLCCLEEAGVDNWEGISYAYELRNEEE
jgi:hypothetical protein